MGPVGHRSIVVRCWPWRLRKGGGSLTEGSRPRSQNGVAEPLLVMTPLGAARDKR